MNLKNQLKALLSHRDMKASELSRKSGVSKQVISLWLSGASPKNVEQVKAVADALKVSVDNLLFGEGEEQVNAKDQSLEALLSGDGWLSGTFEIRVRRLKKIK